MGFEYLNCPDEKVKRLRWLPFVHLPNTIYTKKKNKTKQNSLTDSRKIMEHHI